MKTKDRNKFLIKSFLIFTMLLTAINCYGIGEIRSGSEIASYTVSGNFDYIPKNLAFYNYEIIFSRIDHSNIAIEVHNYFKEIKDTTLSSDIENKQKIKRHYSVIDNFFNENVFSEKDTYLERAFKIFNWVNKNIDYKISLEKKLETPLSVFTQKEGDCYGYTVLTVYLLRLSGIPAKSVFSYLYNKSRIIGISGDYYHSLVTVHHPFYGWILCEPQKMFFCATTDHIPIFTEDDSPKSTVRYYEKAGEMEFVTDDDEESYQKNKFLEVFIKSDKNGEKRIIESDIRIKSITNIVEFKFISGMNRLYDGYLLDEIELPVSSENNSFIMMNRTTNLTFKLVYEADKQLIHYQNEQNELYTADNGNKFIYGLKTGDYNVFYLRRDIPVEIYRLRVENGIPNFSLSEVNFLLEKGNFKKAVVSISDLGEMEIKREQTGYIFSKELQYDEKTPIYVNYNDNYFYIFGLKKQAMSITLHSNNGKKIIRDLK